MVELGFPTRVPDDDLPTLVHRAVDGDQAAWNAIVDRFAALVWSICRTFRLGESDAADVAQTVWLRAVEHLPVLRESRALPGWLSTTTRNECLRVLRQQNRRSYYAIDDVVEQADDEPELDAAILAAERRHAIREAFALLPKNCRELLEMLVTDERLSYADISASLQMPVGSIGPTRARCLDKLRANPVLSGFGPHAAFDQGGL